MGEHRYEGGNVDIMYDVKRCIHAAECVKGLPAVFDPNRKPWVDPDGASADEIAQAIHACPTGALRYERKDGGEAEAPAEACAVHCAEDGPLYATGPMRVRGVSDEEGQVESRVAFCRCGASKNKPFCDNSHDEAGFRASGAIDISRCVADDVQADAPEVVVTPHENGPFQFDGMIAVSGAGHDGSHRFLQPWLCRCGGSKNKPFCDGSHKEIGFQAEGL